MQNTFSLKLLNSNSEEGILIVLLHQKKKSMKFYANILSFRRFDSLETELLNRKQNYFYKKNMLVVHDLSELNLRKIITEMEHSGDFYEIMQPLTTLYKFQFKWLRFKKKLLHWFRF